MEQREQPTPSQANVGAEYGDAAGWAFAPPDVLVRIFSMVTDGTVLLDVLPLVCRHWHRVARDPAAWAGVRLRLQESNESLSVKSFHIMTM